MVQELVATLARRGPGPAPELAGDPEVDVVRATHDSRRAGPGVLFCCAPGEAHDGHDFAPAAVAAGSPALLVERPLGLGVPELRVASVREAMGPVAAALAGYPSDRLAVVGVTGTNGKTTTTQLLAAILEAAGRPCGLIGTLTGARTTPEGPDLQPQLAAFAAEGCRAVAMEVSSHALDRHRVDGTRFAVAVFTNLSHDHLDYHRTMEAYFAAKARLFTPELAAAAVVNLDDPYGRRLAGAAAVPTAGYALADAEDLRLDADGSTWRWRGSELHLPLPGRFNVANALAAATAAEVLGIDHPAIAAGLAATATVAGRFERVDEGQPFLAAVDYAHTPDGLHQLLAAARELTGGRVILVFGAGGDRDVEKRPEMGAAAAAGADVVLLTSDNPRSEDPAAIIDAVRAGMDHPRDLRVEPDRAAAIAAAVAEARPGDVVLVAGKGHETTQVSGTESRPFDDRLVLRDALRSAGHRAGVGS
jgi:UDP-N-acetylmuramoyl-L-alanyl-D-glutamate--2,6-diaminopimelate ligase